MPMLLNHGLTWDSKQRSNIGINLKCKCIYYHSAATKFTKMVYPSPILNLSVYLVGNNTWLFWPYFNKVLISGILLFVFAFKYKYVAAQARPLLLYWKIEEFNRSLLDTHPFDTGKMVFMVSPTWSCSSFDVDLESFHISAENMELLNYVWIYPNVKQQLLIIETVISRFGSNDEEETTFILEPELCWSWIWRGTSNSSTKHHWWKRYMGKC